MAAKKSTQLVIIGVSVFVIGAGLVFLGLRSGGDKKAPPAAAAAKTAKDQADVSATTVNAVKAAGQNVAAAVPIPKGLQAVAVSLDHVQGLAGYAKPGDFVNVYAAVKAGGDDEKKQKLIAPWAKLILSNVQVLDVSGATAGVPGGEPIFLLALNAADAEKVVFFGQFEKLWMTLVPKGQPAANTAGIDYDHALR
jgi:hypothetical protein